MKKTIKKSMQKIILIVCLTIIITASIMPKYVQADVLKEPNKVGGTLSNPIKSFITLLPDALMNLIQSVIFDTNSGEKTSAAGEGLTFPVTPGNDARDNANWWDDANDNNVAYPGYLYVTPETIFSNKVAFLNADFINEMKDDDYNKSVDGTKFQDSINDLRKTIAKWYVAIRTLALVGLLSVLVYIGIRIVLSSASANDRSKYKQMFTYWLSAIVLLFTLHYIMSFTLLMTNKLTQIISGRDNVNVIKTQYVGNNEEKSNGNKFTINNQDDETDFNNFITIYGDEAGKIYDGTNIIGVANFTQYARLYSNLTGMVGWRYLIVYIALVAYTVYFFFIYTKRVIYMAFLTLIAPLITLTYPLDKLNDGQAQAFGVWIKEFVFNALLQPFHLLIYTIFIGTAIKFATNNLIYTIVVLGFMIKAEKLLRKMFGFEKASTAGAFSGAAAGSIVANAISKAGGRLKGGSGTGGNGENSESGGNSDNTPVRTAEQDDPFAQYGKNTGSSRNEDDKQNNLPEGENNNENRLPSFYANDTQQNLDEYDGILDEFKDELIDNPRPEDIKAYNDLYGEQNDRRAAYYLRKSEEQQAKEKQPERTAGQKIKGGFKAIAERERRKIGQKTGMHLRPILNAEKGEARRRAIRKQILNGIKLNAPKALRAGTRYTAATAAGIFAGSSALISGDPKTVLSATTMAAKGGEMLGRKIGDKATKKTNSLSDTFKKGYWDKDYNKRKNEKEDNEFENSQQTYDKYLNEFGDKEEYGARDAIKEAKRMRRETGVTNDDSIIAALKTTKEYGGEKRQNDPEALELDVARNMPLMDKYIDDGIFNDHKKYEIQRNKIARQLTDKHKIDTTTAKNEAERALRNYAKYKGKALPVSGESEELKPQASSPKGSESGKKQKSQSVPKKTQKNGGNSKKTHNQEPTSKIEPPQPTPPPDADNI